MRREKTTAQIGAAVLNTNRPYVVPDSCTLKSRFIAQRGVCSAEKRLWLGDPCSRNRIWPSEWKTFIISGKIRRQDTFKSLSVESTDQHFCVQDRTIRPSTATMFGGLKIPCPSYAEQTAIADILSEMDAEIGALDAKLAKAWQVKQGMMQELLAGKTRLA